ncbi:MAG TPA: glycosyltransferase [Pyrinomonadaceae bacterium]|jgi:rhamnosyl/mannosyltransferase|nr:glycosyltransferase [Pyrinomonadaceae bacterium]
MVVEIRSPETFERQSPKVAHSASRYPRPARIRVLHVGKYYPPYHGGMESHLEGLSNELNRLVDLEVIVANTSWRTADEIVDGIKVTRVGKLFDLQSAPICPDLVRRIRRAKSDIIHIHWPNPSAVLAYLASGHRGRLVITYHSDVVRQRTLAAAFTPMLRAALKRARAIIVSSPNYIDGSYVLPEFRSRCRVIPFGVSGDYFQQFDPHVVKRIREEYGPRIVLGVGRMVYYKGFEYLVRAMANVDGRLLLIGRGPLREPLTELAAEIGVASRVTFLSEVTDIRPYYQAADVFALSSVMRSEAFGIVQLEAMACGKPVINTQLDSGVTFVSPHGVSGLTVPPENSAALSDGINQLLDRPEWRAELGDGARRRVAENFTVDKMVQRTFQLYQDVMNENAATAK